jgi:hypothetical protein
MPFVRPSGEMITKAIFNMSWVPDCGAFQTDALLFGCRPNLSGLVDAE